MRALQFGFCSFGDEVSICKLRGIFMQAWGNCQVEKEGAGCIFSLFVVGLVDAEELQTL